VKFTGLLANTKLTVEVTYVAMSGRDAAPAELPATSTVAVVTAAGELKVPLREMADHAVYRIRLLSEKK
jgi:hypothetical protein